VNPTAPGSPARAFLRERGVTGDALRIVWDAIPLHTTPGIPEHKEPEVALVTAGVEYDVLGFGFDEITPETRHAVLAAYPRVAFKESIIRPNDRTRRRAMHPRHRRRVADGEPSRTRVPRTLDAPHAAARASDPGAVALVRRAAARRFRVRAFEDGEELLVVAERKAPPAEHASVRVASSYSFVGGGWTTAMPYGLLPVAIVAVVLKVLGSMIDSVLAPWLAT
jgi:hypothetical protein